jgi:TatD DNase family protein
MLDAHCHLDRYPDPRAMARQAEREGTVTIAVTNLPSHFVLGYPHLRTFRRVRLALGLHPLTAASHAAEIETFRELVDQTSYIGEVGLDYSREGIGTRALQEESFRQVLSAIADKPKFLTLHSRGAETHVLDLLSEYRIDRAVFHWFSGPPAALDRVVASGHFFSVNPAMISSARGRSVVERVPPDRMLTETDGPHVRVDERPARPSDVRLVADYLAGAWSLPAAEVESTIMGNFRRVIEHLGPAGQR